ncbi:MAG: hypothetical protein ABIM54_00905 [candidate division WOR-3 bacterium]
MKITKKMKEVKKGKKGKCVRCGKITKEKVFFFDDYDVDENGNYYPTAIYEEFLCEGCKKSIEKMFY